jgi:hypothetical protein
MVEHLPQATINGADQRIPNVQGEMKGQKLYQNPFFISDEK